MPDPGAVRRATEADLRSLVALEQVCFPLPWSEVQISSSLTSELAEILLLGGSGLEPSAYAVFQFVADEAELLRIGVCPDRRGRGEARRLLTQGLERLRMRGLRTCHLEVAVHNEAARALYRALGFEPVGFRRGYYSDGSDAVLYSLDLSTPRRS
ncbi:MAG: GNAT family N-acetyltransferase [Holophagales bacterium]|nr:MAG: GNAT family N-acetyltransferase [Holophagales bacterium]